MEEQMPREHSDIIKNYALGKYGFKEQAFMVYNKYKDSDLFLDTIEMQYMDEVSLPVNNHMRKEVIRAKLLKLKHNNKDSIY